MKRDEILSVLKRCANFQLNEAEEGRVSDIGAICFCEGCKDMTETEYKAHYNQCKAELEALPWDGFVENPRLPKENEYPTENGEYITMLDCNEHEVLINAFRNGLWLLYHKTHVKWWMPLTRLEIANE